MPSRQARADAVRVARKLITDIDIRADESACERADEIKTLLATEEDDS